MESQPEKRALSNCAQRSPIEAVKEKQNEPSKPAAASHPERIILLPRPFSRSDSQARFRRKSAHLEETVSWWLRKQLPSSCAGDEAPKSWDLKKTSLGEIEICPVDSVLQNTLLAAWKHFLLLARAIHRPPIFLQVTRGIAIDKYQIDSTKCRQINYEICITLFALLVRMR
jgi:hypothetical protein